MRHDFFLIQPFPSHGTARFRWNPRLIRSQCITDERLQQTNRGRAILVLTAFGVGGDHDAVIFGEAIKERMADGFFLFIGK